LKSSITKIFNFYLKPDYSVGLALPKPIRDGMKRQPGDELKITLQNNRICIKKMM
jgi:hypothetical protein